MKIIRIAKKEEIRFYDQIYSDNDGEWDVPDIFEYAKENGKKVKIPIEKLLNNFDPSPYEKPDEIPGSPEFIERSNKSDLSYPLIVIKYPDGLFIADGVHRLWKARDKGLKEVKVYLIDHLDLKNIPLSSGS